MNEKISKDKITFNTSKAKEFFLEQISFTITPFELDELIKNYINAINVIDVRRYDDYIDGHIPYAIHLPMEEFDENLKMLEKDKVNIVYGYSELCKLTPKACYMIAHKGYPTMLLRGGYRAWEKLDFDTVKTSDNE